MLYWLLNPVAVFVCRMFFHVKVKGRENLPRKGGLILASNHRSYVDPIVVAVASNRRLNFMARDDLFRNPLFGWFIHSLGAFPVKRHSADLSAMKEALRRLKRGGALLLFPEGTRAADGLIHEAQPGIGFLIAKSGCPVVPVFIKNSDVALPRGGKSIRSAKIEVYFGQQIPIEGRLPYEDIAALVMDNIRRLAC
jgi:1-acyl-sn-glycerol-3-phosphate acyltransferase